MNQNLEIQNPRITFAQKLHKYKQFLHTVKAGIGVCCDVRQRVFLSLFFFALPLTKFAVYGMI